MSVIRFLERPAPISLDPAIALLGNEPEGAAFDFMNMRGYIRDRVTGSNNWLGDPNAKLTYASPSAKWIWNAFGALASGTTLRCDHDPASLDSSTTPLNSMGIGAGAVVNKSIVLASGTFTYPVGEVIRITDATDITKWILGRVVSWTAGTKTLVIAGYAASAVYVAASSWKVIVALGIRVESQRTILNLRLVPALSGGWSGWPVGSSSQKIGLISGTTAYSFAGNGTGSRSNIATLGTALAAGSVFCLSAVIEQETAAVFTWGLFAGTFTNLSVFTWATGAITTSAGSAPVASGVIELGIGPNGGRMVQVWVAITAAGGEAPYIYPNGTGAVSTSTIFHAFQIEAGAYPTSLINSVGTQVTRAADRINLATSLFPFSTSISVIAQEVRALPGAVAGDCVGIWSGLNANVIGGYQQGAPDTGPFVATARAGGVGVFTAGIGNFTKNVHNKMAVRYEVGNAAAYKSGGFSAFPAMSTMPTGMNTLTVGSQSLSTGVAFWLKSLRYIPRSLSNAELQGLTA